MPAESKKQQRFMGMVHAVQKGELSPREVGPAVRKAAREMKYSDAKDYAKTKHKGLPEKKGSVQMKYFEKNSAFKPMEALKNILSKGKKVTGPGNAIVKVGPREVMTMAPKAAPKVKRLFDAKALASAGIAGTAVGFGLGSIGNGSEKKASVFKVQKDGSIKIYDDIEVGMAKHKIRKGLKDRAKKMYPGKKIYFYDELGEK